MSITARSLRESRCRRVARFRRHAYQMHNNCFSKELYYILSLHSYAQLKDLDNVFDLRAVLAGKKCIYVSSADNSHEKGQHTHRGVAGLGRTGLAYLRPAFGLLLMVDRIDGRFFSATAGAGRPADVA